MDDNKIIEHPNAALRRKVEVLEEKIRNLERDREQRVKTELLMIERYEEARQLFLKGMELFKSVTTNKNP